MQIITYIEKLHESSQIITHVNDTFMQIITCFIVCRYPQLAMQVITYANDTIFMVCIHVLINIANYNLHKNLAWLLANYNTCNANDTFMQIITFRFSFIFIQFYTFHIMKSLYCAKVKLAWNANYNICKI